MGVVVLLVNPHSELGEATQFTSDVPAWSWQYIANDLTATNPAASLILVNRQLVCTGQDLQAAVEVALKEPQNAPASRARSVLQHPI